MDPRRQLALSLVVADILAVVVIAAVALAFHNALFALAYIVITPSLVITFKLYRAGLLPLGRGGDRRRPPRG